MSVWKRLQSRPERFTLPQQNRVSLGACAGEANENWTEIARLLREHELQDVQPNLWPRPIPTPSALGGTWYLCQQPTSIAQHGDQLTFTNELGQIAKGRLLDSTRVIADGWGGLVGIVVQNSILWNNNTVWDRERHLPPNLHGTWSHANQPTRIRQSGNLLTFINERGESSAGRFLDRNQVLATGWSDLRGIIVNSNTIRWSNSSIWSRITSAGCSHVRQERG